MKISQLFPSRFVNADDLGTNEVSVMIRELKVETVAGRKKPVLYFEAKTKGLILNRTNAVAIARLHGEETDAWVGKKIVLFAAMTTFAGEKVKCVRVRER